jgi:hypothetical protein
MSWRGGAANPPQTQADISRAAAPSFSGYLVWRVGAVWHARSNVHATPAAAAAAGVRWFAIACTPAALAEALSTQEATYGRAR